MAETIPVGKFPGPEAKRDAVHIAIIPVTVGDEPLCPGIPIRVRDDGTAAPVRGTRTFPGSPRLTRL